MRSLPEIRRHGSATAFLRRAEKWLLEREAENNLLLGVAYSIALSTAGFEPPLYFATVEAGGEVLGCAFRTPPYKLGLTSMPLEAVEPLLSDLLEVYEELPAVLGPEPVVTRFAEGWAVARGTTYEGGMKQRLYKLEELQPVQWQVEGEMREAEYTDIDLVAQWMDSFTRDTGIPTRHPKEMAELLIDSRDLYLWEKDGPRSMAGTQGNTRNGVRISYVYTPDAFRRRGYASGLVHELSRKQLDSGRKFCVLYTDITNPTSNAIYQTIGYRPLCDVRDYLFRISVSI